MTLSPFPLLFFLLLPLVAVVGSPVVLIPGDGASVLEIKYNKPTVPHWWCAKSSKNKWQRLWFPDPTELLPKNIDCWSENIRLQYNSTDINNAPGVEIRAKPGKEGLELVHGVSKSNVYGTLVAALEDDITVATYDFRISPAGNPDYLAVQLRNMVETIFEQSQTKVTLLTHSLGALFGHYFLTQVVDDEWKAQYIHAWIPISPAYGGVILGLKQLVSGDTGGIPWLSGKDLKEEQRSYECSLWLLPSQQLYGDQVFIEVNETHKQYTANDYHELFADSGFAFNTTWERVKNLTTWMTQGQLQDPNVTVHPIYGTGVDTPVKYVYQSSTLNQEPAVVTNQDGDGTVCLASLQAGNHWLHAQEALIVEGVSHTDILSNQQAVSRIFQVLSDGASEIT